MRTPSLASVALLSLIWGCSKEDAAHGAAVEPVPSSEVPSATLSSSATKAPPEPPKPPTMKLVPMSLPEVTDDVGLHTIDGAVLVSMGNRVGRLLPDGLEWVGEVPKGGSNGGPSIIVDAFGQWPEEVAVLYVSSNGRISMPTYFPVRGGGGEYTFAPGGGLGHVSGVARSGETTTIAGFDFYEGHRIIKLRGPLVKPAYTPEDKVGCEPPPDRWGGGDVHPAVVPSEYAATRTGTILSVGTHCKSDKPALELWRKPTAPSEIVMLDSWLTHGEVWEISLLHGPGDTLYIVSNEQNPIVRYRDGKVEPLPMLPAPRQNAFESPDGGLYASTAASVFELVGDHWELRFELAWPAPMTLARLGDRFVAARGGKLHAFEPTPAIALDPKAATVDCKTPFVHWADVLPQTTKGHAFPETAKRLSTFAGLDRIKLVDFEQDGRRLGIVAQDWETAKAALAHVKASAKNEEPRLICFAPVEPRILKVVPAASKPGKPGAKGQ